MTRRLDDHTLARLGHENLLEWHRESTRWSGRAGRIEESDGLLLFAGATPFPVSFNGVFRLDPAIAATEVLDRADAWFAELGRGYSVSVSGHQGADEDLAAAAAAAGYLLISEPPEMVLRRRVTPPRLPAGVELRWVDDETTLGWFLTVSADAYGTIGMPAGTIEAAVVDPARFMAPWTHSVVAERDGEPLAAAQVVLSHGIAGVYWVGTVGSARGAGLGQAVTSAVSNRAFDAGAAVVTLQASSQGEPIYRRMGYETIYRYQNWARLDAPSAG